MYLRCGPVLGNKDGALRAWVGELHEGGAAEKKKLNRNRRVVFDHIAYTYNIHRPYMQGGRVSEYERTIRWMLVSDHEQFNSRYLERDRYM